MSNISDIEEARNWPEDFPHENGNYLCICRTCWNYFLGHKRRVMCKLCSPVKPSQEVQAQCTKRYGLEPEGFNYRCTLPEGHEGAHKNANGMWFVSELDCLKAQVEQLTREWDALKSQFDATSLRSVPCTEGIALINSERRRQIMQEGWTAAHDDAHSAGELAKAAACYACPPDADNGFVDRLWPWKLSWWKPSADDRVRELVKAGALIGAEIDRLLRAAQSTNETP